MTGRNWYSRHPGPLTLTEAVMEENEDGLELYPGEADSPAVAATADEPLVISGGRVIGVDPAEPPPDLERSRVVLGQPWLWYGGPVPLLVVEVG